jgi:glycine dehydrogenase subunit 1
VQRLVKSFVHHYIPNSVPETKREMMHEIGIQSIEELYTDVPQRFRLKQRLNLPKPMTEHNVTRHVQTLLSKSKNINNMSTFLGSGCWPHCVPAAVDNIVQRAEFLTSYTPYQPEVSQGMLQAMFEYQSMICELTAMDVANTSVYDWASALGEAVRMAVRLNNRTQVLVPKIIHPERLQVLQTYVEPLGLRIKAIDYDHKTGLLNLEMLRQECSEKTAAVYVENPSYLGFVEVQVQEIAGIAHRKGALYIVGIDPTSLGVLKPPGEYDADIVVGEGQPLGNHLNYGGPLLGIFACRGEMELIRQMPGRIIGMTNTLDGNKTGFCMALQTREQHIRREKATSNICTNEALCALASAMYLSLLGPQGLKELGETIMTKACYAMQLLSEIHGVKVPVFESPHFKEFTVNFDMTGKTVKSVHKGLLKRFQIQGGKDISREFPELGKTALYCVTEVHSKNEIDYLAQALKSVLSPRKR